MRTILFFGTLCRWILLRTIGNVNSLKIRKFFKDYLKTLFFLIGVFKDDLKNGISKKILNFSKIIFSQGQKESRICSKNIVLRTKKREFVKTIFEGLKKRGFVK